MIEGQLLALAGRFVSAFERIAISLEGINETHRQQFQRQYPEKREVREAILSRVPSEEDRLREEQGASSQPIDEWLGELDEETKQDIGVREREWLQERHAGAQRDRRVPEAED